MPGHTINFDDEEMRKINIFKATHNLKRIGDAVRKMVRLGYDKEEIKRKL